MIKEYIFHLKKLFYIVLFGSLVWIISFTLFPENQIIKVSIGDASPSTFTAPKYIEIIDEEETEKNRTSRKKYPQKLPKIEPSCLPRAIQKAKSQKMQNAHGA